mgnify:CR=1 FL=1|tara:strand:- start:15871 stop:16014 length:144 start_codon:yes stop_codon:yes gene_type:complete
MPGEEQKVKEKEERGLRPYEKLSILFHIPHGLGLEKLFTMHIGKDQR